MIESKTVNFDMPYRHTEEIKILCCPHEWISTKERLPDTDQIVLMFCKTAMGATTAITGCHKLGLMPESEAYWESPSSEWVNFFVRDFPISESAVLFWMPIPEIPNE